MANDALVQITDYKQDPINCFPCTGCSLHKTATHAGVGYRGNRKPRVLVCGEGLGPNEDKKGLPFVGDSGQQLEKWFKQVGLNINDFAISNIVQCIPIKDPTKGPQTRGNFRPPTDLEISHCQSRILNEIVQLDPEYILALGSVSSWFFLNKGEKRNKFKAAEKRGKLFRIKIGSKTYKVFPTLHPSAVLRNPLSEPQYLRDFGVLKSMLDGTFGTDLPTTIVAQDTYHAIELIQEIINAYKEGKTRFFTLDIETSTLHPWEEHARILGAALCYGPGKAVYIPLYAHGRGLQDNTFYPSIDHDKVVTKLRELIATVPMGNQNFKFDLGWIIQKWDVVDIKQMFADPMIMAHLIYGELRYDGGKDDKTESSGSYEGKGYYSLKILARDFLFYPDYDRGVKIWVEKTSPPSFANVPLDEIAKYAGVDAEAAYRLILVFEPMIAAENLYLPNTLTTAAAHVFTYIEAAGFHIDQDYLNELTEMYPSKIYESYIKILKDPKVIEYLDDLYKTRIEREGNKKTPKFSTIKEWREIAAKLKPGGLNKVLFKEIGFNPSSSKQVGEIIFQRYGLPVDKAWKTKKGNISVNAAVVKAIAEKAEENEALKPVKDFVQLVVGYRNDSKIADTYTGKLRKYITPQGNLHSNYHLIGTKTGRASTSGFGIHTIPKASRANIKNMFVSRWKDPK